jgi:hypothetical protein
MGLYACNATGIDPGTTFGCGREAVGRYAQGCPQGEGEYGIKGGEMQPISKKLGKLRRRDDSRTLQLAKYLDSSLPRPPRAVDNSHGITSWGMMANDTLGDCTCAAVGHLVQDWTANASSEVTIPDPDIVSLYEAVSGYKPGDPSTDNGAECLTVLNYWRNKGVPGEGDKIAAYVALTPGDYTHVEDALYLFGGVYIGLQLPLSAQNQAVWAQSSGPDAAAGSWGGHCVAVVGYDGGGLTCVTWGALQRMTWGFWHTYCDEAYGVLSADWIEKSGDAPVGFDLAQLQADLTAVTG